MFLIFVVLFKCFVLIFAVQNNTKRIVIEGRYGEEINRFIDDKTEYIIEYRNNTDIYPVRLTVTCPSAETTNPLLIVAQQQTIISSWQLPYNMYYKNLAHTLCPGSMRLAKQMPTSKITKSLLLEQIASNPVVTIRAPSQGSRFSFFLTAVVQRDFFIKANIKYTSNVAVSRPIYYYYNFLDSDNSAKDSGAVLVQASSPSSHCMLISIQNSTCPIFDLENNIKFDSYWQTMTYKAGIVVKKSIYPNGFYIVMVVKQDDSECGLNIPGAFTFDRIKPIELKVKNTISVKEHIEISLITLAIFGGIFLICIIIGLIYLVKTIRKEKNEISIDQAESTELTNMHQSNRWRQLFRASSRSKTSTNYVWHVGIVALFYTFPVLQLVFTYQRIVHETGNEDICYYNFLCAHPLGLIYDFNHVYSNIGYVVLGLLFLILTYFKELMERSTQNGVFGLQKPYGMFYALGFALIMEGIMSACYHVCPKSSNFQFDTSFMYVMTVLMIVNVYENRHSTGDQRGYAVFGILAGATTLSVISLLIGETLYFWIIFAIIQIGLCLFLTWTLDKTLFKMIFNSVDRKNITGVHICRIVLWILGNIINWLIVAYGIYSRSGFGTYLLMVFIVNGLFYTIFYISMKICHKEKILLITWIFIVLATVIWGFALYFFVSNETSWEKSPAQSRNLNEECALVRYYDRHDIWHFLSSLALFFTFIVLLTLDEGLAQVPRADITDFHSH